MSDFIANTFAQGGWLNIALGLGIGIIVLGLLVLIAFLAVRSKGKSYIDSAYHGSGHHSGTCCH